MSIIMLIFFFSGCSTVPKPISGGEFSEQAQKDRQNVIRNQEPVTRPISLYEALARALKYNLDFHLEVAEKILSQRELDVSRYELLPQLVSNLNYSSRDKFSGASSRSLLTGVESLQTSTSSERDVLSADLSLTWNVLDFGLSYVRTKQAADKVLISEEEKRKVVNRLVQDVRTAYWRAVSNDRLIKKLESLMEKVKEAIEESKKVEVERLDRPLTALTYQRELIGIKRELEELQRDLSLAKIQLAALMNLSPGEDYDLVIPERTTHVNSIDLSPQLMEQLALENRPELREVSYESRINSYEAKAAILSLLPGMKLNFGKNYNSNSFLFNQNWLAYGAQVSWNLLNIFKLPATNRQLTAREKVLEARRLALSMAIMTQVHVSLAQYYHSGKEYKTAADYYITQKKILAQLEAATKLNTVSRQSLIREEMNMLVAEVKYDIAYSDLQNAYASIYAAIGTDLLVEDGYTSSLDGLTAELKEKLEMQSLHEQIFHIDMQ